MPESVRMFVDSDLKLCYKFHRTVGRPGAGALRKRGDSPT